MCLEDLVASIIILLYRAALAANSSHIVIHITAAIIIIIYILATGMTIYISPSRHASSRYSAYTPQQQMYTPQQMLSLRCYTLMHIDMNK